MANNLANLSTAGFKAERLVMRELSERPATSTETPKDITFVDGWALQRDFSAGAMEQTGNPLDLAINGDGFFVIEKPDGEVYTRDGRFTLDADGTLVNRLGDPVLGDGGPIVVDPTLGDIAIAPDGTISQQGVEAGRIRLVEFDTPGALEKLGDSMWRATDEAPRNADMVRILPGFIEGSNVNAVLELTQMIEISRAYQSVSKMISQSDELRGAAIDKLARIG